MIHLTTAPQAIAARSTIRLFADAHKPYPQPDFPGDGEYKMLDIVTANDGNPCTPRIKTLITARLGNDWQFLSWSMPEPDDCTEFYIAIPTKKCTLSLPTSVTRRPSGTSKKPRCRRCGRAHAIVSNCGLASTCTLTVQRTSYFKVPAHGIHAPKFLDYVVDWTAVHWGIERGSLHYL